MCFSATASFVAGGALSATGILTLSKVRGKKELMLAGIPLLFGIQQLIDGVVWVSFGTPALNTAALYAYASLAFVLWPLYIPVAVLSLETSRVRKEILEALSVVGLGVSLFFSYFMIFGTTTAQIVNHCVVYDTPHPYRFTILAFYLLAACGAFFISGKRLLNVFGGVIFISFAITGWFYIESFTSVWCFFSAIMSIMIYYYFDTPRSHSQESEKRSMM